MCVHTYIYIYVYVYEHVVYVYMYTYCHVMYMYMCHVSCPDPVWKPAIADLALSRRRENMVGVNMVLA